MTSKYSQNIALKNKCLNNEHLITCTKVNGLKRKLEKTNVPDNLFDPIPVRILRKLKLNEGWVWQTFTVTHGRDRAFFANKNCKIFLSKKHIFSMFLLKSL